MTREGKQAEKAGDRREPASGRGQTCPICGKPTDRVHRPFCSRRCADVDLNRWLSGSYAIPGRDGEAADIIPDSDDGESDEK